MITIMLFNSIYLIGVSSFFSYCGIKNILDAVIQLLG